MSKFKSVVTALGQARIASAIESGKDVNITHLAVGDGNGSATTPSASQTALVHETYRLPLNSIKTDNKNANWIIAEAIIPASIGGFWMREMGLFSSEGELIAVSNMADSYKPTLEEGSGRTQTLRMVITVTNTDAVTLTIDDTLVIATEEYVNNLLAEHEASRRHPDGTLTDKGFVQLSSAVDSASEILAATPKAVKTVNDNANGRLPSGGTAVAATKLASARKIAGEAFDGTADISITAANVGAFPVQGGTVGSAGVSTPTLVVTDNGWIEKKGNQKSGDYYQTNGLRIVGRTDMLVDIFHSEVPNSYHNLGFHVFGGGNEGWFTFRNDGTLITTGGVIAAAATANEHAVNLAQLNAAVAKRALLAGSTVQTFDVAQATSWGHAVRLDQFQSGNNGNGAWVKLPNGTQWCRQNLSIAANTTTTWTFPAGFSGTPALFISTFNGELKAWFNGASNSGANIYNSSNISLNVNLLAIW
jgi:hypothetical protein